MDIPSVEVLKEVLMTIYDPPSGWRYGFPRPYLPEPGESLEDTLRRDRYPEKEIEAGMAKWVRFWKEE
jgi:hypothetical protein